jgi:hydroxymethylpyrimidine/phosphomethylpyrimidine kinase
VKVALTIAGSDPGGGAGIQADLRTFGAFSVHGLSVVAALTAQGTERVSAVFPVEPQAVAAQIDAVAADFPVDAVKVGMLGTEDVAAAVAERLVRHGFPNVVLDPVLAAGSGERLFTGRLSKILAAASVLTPNLAEAEALLDRTVRDVAEMREAARALAALGPRIVVVKGGHLDGDAVDVFFDGERLEELRAPRIPGKRPHGAGCSFSSALAAGLALGEDPLGAVRGAKAFVRAALAASVRFGERDFLARPPRGDGSSGW